DRLEGQCVAPDDVALKDEPDGVPAFVPSVALEQTGVDGVEDAVKPLAALPYVVVQNVNTVDRGDGQDSVALKVQLRLAIALLHSSQFPFQNHTKKIPVAAGGFEETGVDPVRLLLHQIEHGIDLALPGQHLATIRNPLLRDDLRDFHRRSAFVDLG